MWVQLLLDKLSYIFTGLEVVHDTILKLTKGAVYGQVSKMARDSKYYVETPKGIAGIRGTRYKIDENGNVIVTTGTVIMSIPPNTYTITEGNAFDAATGTISVLATAPPTAKARQKSEGHQHTVPMDGQRP